MRKYFVTDRLQKRPHERSLGPTPKVSKLQLTLHGHGFDELWKVLSDHCELRAADRQLAIARRQHVAHGYDRFRQLVGGRQRLSARRNRTQRVDSRLSVRIQNSFHAAPERKGPILDGSRTTLENYKNAR